MNVFLSMIGCLKSYVTFGLGVGLGSICDLGDILDLIIPIWY